MARRAVVSLVLLAVIAAVAGQRRNQVKDDSSLHRLNENVVYTAFTGRNEVVCVFCLFQVLVAAYQLGNDEVRREISDTLGSRQLEDLGSRLLAATASRSTLSGTLTGYYQRGLLNRCPASSRSSRCVSDARTNRIDRIVKDVGKEVDFRNSRTTSNINAEVERATRGLIRNLFADIPASTQLVFASTLVFSDQWPSRLTAVMDNFRAAGSNRDVRVPTLVHEATLPVLDGSSGDGVLGVSMPYRDSSVRLNCFTTDQEGSDIRDQLLEKHYRNLAKAPQRFTQVRLPKFDIASSKYSYVDLMKQIGISAMFQGGLGYDEELKVNQLVHKAVIQTDENGTTAAGAAGIAIVPTSLGPRPFVLRFNKPFVCSLVDVELEQPLFTTYIADPQDQTGGSGLSGSHTPRG